MTIGIDGHALHIFLFAPLQPGAGSPERALGRAWGAASKLGMSAPALDLDRPVELPDTLPTDDAWFRLLAAKTDSDARNTAIMFTAHDVAAVVVRLRPPANETDGADIWTGLSRAWRNAAGDEQLTGALGAVHVFTGFGDHSAAALAIEATAIARKVQADHAGSGLELSAVIEPGIAVWDMEVPWGRSIVTLADRDTAAVLDEWCWLTGGNDDLGRFVRYFMHASKLRFEVSVFQRGISELREQEHKLDADLTEMFALHQQFESEGVSTGQLIDAQSRLGRDQGEAAGLLISITRLRDLRQTVEIAAHNLRAYQPDDVEPAPSTMSPFARELALADWLAHRVQHEIAYLESCRERVGEAQKLTELRLQQISAAQGRTANLLTVLQTGLLGALLGAFSISNTLGAKFSVPTSVRAAMMAFVASVAFLLPVLALRWTNRYAWPELTGAGIIGAAAGWLCAVLLSSRAPLWMILLSAAVGAVALAGGASLANGRHPRN
ncbi:MAG TPA: CATRA conflict system CASPASE/TPR repeat-associated protein [Mycobacterium sp.]